ncbi:MAG: hypothetical protein IIW38_03955 [Alistipes sp.]|nr:hypothetical protein [Alistipes sp.]MBQ5836732.1 hypothetical protein [Alistipes sp.]
MLFVVYLFVVWCNGHSLLSQSWHRFGLQNILLQAHTMAAIKAAPQIANATISCHTLSTI